jgi:hypothetical protein
VGAVCAGEVACTESAPAVGVRLAGEDLPLKNRNSVARNSTMNTSISEPNIVSVVGSVVVVVLVTMPVMMMGSGVEVVVWVVELVCVRSEYAVAVVVVCC